MGGIARGARKVAQPIPGLLTPPQRKAMVRANVENFFPTAGQDSPEAAAGAAGRHFGMAQPDPDSPTPPLTPAAMGLDAVKEGGPLGGHDAGQSLFELLMENGQSVPTSRRNARSVHVPGMQISTERFPGQPSVITSRDGFIATQTTPFDTLAEMTGSEARAHEIFENMGQRNLPGGMGDAWVYHAENLPEFANIPVTEFAALKRGFPQRAGLPAGLFDEHSRSIFYSLMDDPALSKRRAGLEHIPDHERIHAITDAVPVDRAFHQRQLSKRPAISDVDWDSMPENARSRLYNGYEIGNAIFGAKRLEEITNSQLRNLGDKDAADYWWNEIIPNFEPGHGDPLIDLPGHPRHGQPAHGYEDLLWLMQQMQEAAGKKGKADLRQGVDKFGQTADLKQALMA